MLPTNVELAERILGELKDVGFARDRGVASQKEIFERKRQKGLYLGPSIQWGCYLENGKLVPHAKNIQRLWALVRKTRNPRQSAIKMGFRYPEGVYPVLRSHRYVELGAISQEDFDAVRKIMAENLGGRLQPLLGLRYDEAGNLIPGKRFPLIVKVFSLRGKQKTLDEIEAATRVDRAQVHKILKKHAYKSLLDTVDPALWRDVQNVKINGAQRMHDWARERKQEALAKIRTRLSQRQASAKQLGKVAGVYWSVVLEYLKPLIKGGEVERVRNGNQVFYRLSRHPREDLAKYAL